MPDTPVTPAPSPDKWTVNFSVTTMSCEWMPPYLVTQVSVLNPFETTVSTLSFQQPTATPLN